MAKRGVYDKGMQKVIDDTNKLCEARHGWVKTKIPMLITEKMLEHYGCMVDWWNPLWRDPAYARNTRWGRVVAAPFYQQAMGMVQFDMEANPEYGYFVSGGAECQGDFGNDWEFSRPIRAGDTLRIWQNCEYEDVTIDGEDTPYAFNCNASYHYINQNDELISSCIVYLGHGLDNKPQPPRRDDRELPKYTKEDLEYIRQLEDEEEILGARIRYWEDVNIGDEIKAVVRGPTTVLDMYRYFGYYMVASINGYFSDRPPLREESRQFSKFIKVDPVTNTYHDLTEGHLWDRSVPLFGGKYAFELHMSQRSLIARAITNWMGDDGFIKKFIFRTNGTEIVKDVLDKEYTRGGMIVGSTNIAKGKVVNKRVENNEFLVDLVMWTEDITGALSKGAQVTVNLLSKDDPLKWVKR